MKFLLTIAITFFALGSSSLIANEHEAKAHDDMNGMDHEGMKDMERHDMKDMKGMDHEGMKDMKHHDMKCMKGMDHEGMKGMGHHDMKDMEPAAHGHQGGADAHGGSHSNSAGTPLPPTEFVDSVFKVTLLDTMKIEYDKHLDIKTGNVVKFIVTNKGKLRHEFSISNAEEQIAHVRMMRKMPDMKHDDGTTISVESGETAEMVWKFDGETEVVFSCNIPGHSEAGMLTQVSLVGTVGHHGH